MADPYVRQVGTVSDLDGARLVVGVDYDTVTLGYPNGTLFRLPASAAEEFGQLFVQAIWAAALAQAELAITDRAEASHG